MKKSISFLLSIVLIFSSFSFCFASPTVWDTTDQSNLQYIRNSLTNSTGTVVSALNTIITNTNTIANHLNTIKGYLVDSGQGVAYWVNAISTWMSPIYNAITNIPVDLTSISQGLWHDIGNGNQKAFLSELSLSLTNYYKGNSTLTNAQLMDNAHLNLVDSNGVVNRFLIQPNGQFNLLTSLKWQNGTPLGNIAGIIQTINANQAYGFNYRWAADLTGYNSLQSLVSFADPDSTVTFTPQSATDGIYKYLNAINTPLARLGYVLASDSRIEAQEAASANEQAVVDNFIDPNGLGSASTSDIDSVADFSSGYQSTFSSDASPTGIFNLFTSDNMSWFSQETANQLDTTSNNRAKFDNTFNTPLLDQQINSIYEQLGVKQP